MSVRSAAFLLALLISACTTVVVNTGKGSASGNSTDVDSTLEQFKRQQDTQVKQKDKDTP